MGSKSTTTTAANETGLCNTSDMLLLHRVFRREFAQMQDHIRKAGANRDRAKIVGAYALEIVGIVHVHHHGEDDLLYPLLNERVQLDRELFAVMDAQHVVVSKALETIRADLTSWVANPSVERAEHLATEISEMLGVLNEHLDQEERSILPIAARTVSQAEWDKMAEHGLGSLAKSRRLVVLGHILADTTEAEFDEFQAGLPTPVRVLYRLIGRRQYTKEIAAVRAG